MNENEEESHPNDSMSELLKNIAASSRDAGLVAGAYLYYIGYAYLKHYYDQIGFNIWSFDLPFYTILVYSGRVLRENDHAIVFNFMILFFLFSALRFVHLAHTETYKSENAGEKNAFYGSGEFLKIITLFGIFIWLFYFFISSIKYAQSTALQAAQCDMIENLDTFASIYLKFHDNKDKNYPMDLERLNKKGQLRLLVDTRDSYFVLSPRFEIDRIYRRRIFRISTSDANIVVNAPSPIMPTPSPKPTAHSRTPPNPCG